MLEVKLISIILGLFYVNYRYSDKLVTFFITSLVAFSVSFLCLLPFFNENQFNFNEQIQHYPYWFVVTYAILNHTVNRKNNKIILTEGITLMQSLAIVYWGFDLKLYQERDTVLLSIFGFGLLFCLYACYHALSKSLLTRNSRLYLSICISVITIIFAFDFLVHLLIKDQHVSNSFYSQLLIGVQFFLLGVSSMFILQNTMLLFRFRYARGKELVDLKNEHIDRFSNKQIERSAALTCLLYATMIYSINFFFHIVPKNTAIWIVFVTFPFVLMLIKQWNSKIKK